MSQAIVIAVIAAGLWFGGHEAVKGVKKLSRETVCIVKYGRPCPKK